MTQAGGMPEQYKPRVGPGGLVTVAYLKARLDAGEDQLGIFLPLVLDVLPSLPNQRFTTEEVRDTVEQSNHVSMPLGTVATLLGRAVRQGLVERNAGRFQLRAGSRFSSSRVRSDKAQVEAAQVRLGNSLQEHARLRGLVIATATDALDLILRFLETQQVAVVLGLPLEEDVPNLSRLECGAVVEFLHDVVPNDPALSSVLEGIVEGLVLYHAAFLPDLNEASRKFEGLTVVFDSVLVRQALGYEGRAARALVRETMDLLVRTGARCVVFDTTIDEIHRILRMYQEKLATAAGRLELRPSDMARYFLTQKYTPSDVQEMSALLEQEVSSAGFEMMRMPKHVAESTYDEQALAARLADPKTGDLNEPRVQHDVDCVAGVLTLRRQHRSARIEGARAVFATLSGLVIRNTQSWWFEHEKETGVPPIVHFRALANLAWVKKPASSPGLPLRDLVALCTVAMRPGARIWQRFQHHLKRLQADQRLSEDQATAIIVSALSDQLLHDVELEHEDPDDVDSATLDEVVDRVVADYTAKAHAELAAVTQTYQTQLAESQSQAAARVADAEKQATSLTERLRRRDLANEARSRQWASMVALCAYAAILILVLVGMSLVAARSLSEDNWMGLLGAIAVAAFTLLEGLGALGHLRAMRFSLQDSVQRRLYQWLSGETQ